MKLAPALSVRRVSQKRKVLAEIPQQVVEYMANNRINACPPRARPPVPPPRSQPQAGYGVQQSHAGYGAGTSNAAQFGQ